MFYRTPHTAHRKPHTAHRKPHTTHRTRHTDRGVNWVPQARTIMIEDMLKESFVLEKSRLEAQGILRQTRDTNHVNISFKMNNWMPGERIERMTFQTLPNNPQAEPRRLTFQPPPEHPQIRPLKWPDFGALAVRGPKSAFPRTDFIGEPRGKSGHHFLDFWAQKIGSEKMPKPENDKVDFPFVVKSWVPAYRLPFFF